MAEQADSRPAPLELTLYSRRDCALCDEMCLELERWDAGRKAYTLSVVDIETDEELVRRYGRRIPVLVYGRKELCAGHFRADALEALSAA